MLLDKLLKEILTCLFSSLRAFFTLGWVRYCLVSGSQTKETVNANTLAPIENEKRVQVPSATAKKIIDINQPQICKNKGCGQTFKEKDNHETACSYHPGPAIFHDRIRGVQQLKLLSYGLKSLFLLQLCILQCSCMMFMLCLQWKCCDIHVKEFDEFMSIPPCTTGWHNADPTS